MIIPLVLSPAEKNFPKILVNKKSLSGRIHENDTFFGYLVA